VLVQYKKVPEPLLGMDFNLKFCKFEHIGESEVRYVRFKNVIVRNGKVEKAD